MIITDDHLIELARFTRVLNWAWSASMLLEDEQTPRRLVNTDVDVAVREMHLANELWRESSRSLYSSTQNLDERICAMIEQTCGTDLGPKNGPLLGGCSVHALDRKFIERDLPGLHSRLSYRNFDVSTIGEFAHRFWPEIAQSVPDKPTTHRAESDCAWAIEAAKHYARRLGPVCRG